MYNYEVAAIISRLREKIKDKDILQDLDELALYSELRSNALSEYERKERLYLNKIKQLSDSLDSADGIIDSLEFSNARLARLAMRSIPIANIMSRLNSEVEDDESE